MIDNMTFWCIENSIIKHLTKGFFSERCDIFVCFNNERTFKLYNPHNYQPDNYLRIHCVGFGKCLIIHGSLRKWYLSENSLGDTLNDLTQQEYENALELLFSLLKIDHCKREYFNISRIEIGQNILVKESCTEILHRFIGYKSSCYQAAHRRGYKKYESKSLNVTMYNKITEISKEFKKKLIKTSEQDDFLKKNEKKNILRIEFTLKNGHANVKNRLGIGNLDESISNFGLFYSFFWERLHEIQFSNMYNNEPVFDATNKSQKEIFDFVKLFGLYTLGEERMNQMIDVSKDPRNIRQAIKKLHNLSGVRNGCYDKCSLLEDTKQKLMLSMKESEISMSFINNHFKEKDVI